jgi:hypothetical protein
MDDKFTSNYQRLIFAHKEMDISYPDPFWFFSEKYIFNIDSISYLPIISYFAGIIWISSTFGLYESENNKETSIFFKIISFFMIGFSIILSLAYYIDLIQLYLRYVFYDFKYFFQFDVLFHLTLWNLIIILNIIIFAISYLNHIEEKQDLAKKNIELNGNVEFLSLSARESKE